MIRFTKGPASAPRVEKPSHRFTVGQMVRIKSRIGIAVKDAETFHVKATLPAKDGSPQYRIRSDGENHERVTTEDNLEDVEAVAE
ncbi:hypothetical protein [Aminobacter ciceronei]|uniref:Hypervirulence associated protein TUDOR domain-containing protein n=1 Tax=Aminobacter ciceronei TaxID=150723 RepID=A0ABR6C0A9_9HYPH|nr:hypothetical protein [Aminobacter ciceronei]MBA8904626.1 hypothetical protein [Aminobacter ciceronei]MBA9018404.1 hypothetical protein [Aminobacter ciceronei]WMC95613.1 hypothetical protein RAR13_19830 [Aminobacter aminovorans]